MTSCRQEKIAPDGEKAPHRECGKIRELMHAMMEHNTLSKVGLEAAQEETLVAHRIAIAVAERMSAILVHDRESSILDFWRLHLTSFFGTGLR